MGCSSSSVFGNSVVGLAEAGVPAIFILVDSTADVGTNNFLPGSMARADFPHNDFPFSIATGRFSNGLNSADFLSKQFGLKRSPRPFLSLNTTSLHKKSFRGVNFASGGSALLDIKIFHFLVSADFDEVWKRENSIGAPFVNRKNVISLSEQIQQLSLVKSNLAVIKGQNVTDKLTSKSLFFISTGSNDLSPVLKWQSLIDLGARKFGIIIVAPIGCCPSQMIWGVS